MKIYAPYQSFELTDNTTKSIRYLLGRGRNSYLLGFIKCINRPRGIISRWCDNRCKRQGRIYCLWIFIIGRGSPLAPILTDTAFIGIWLDLYFFLLIVEYLLVCFDMLIVLRFTKILEGMTAITIETISIRNISETGSIYFCVNSGAFSNQINVDILSLCEW